MNASQLSALPRRAFLHGAGMGLGALELNQHLIQGRAANLQRALTQPHHAPRAKSVIFLHMVGAPSQLDLFDYKPKLVELDRTPSPDEFIEGKTFAFLRGRPKLLGTPYQFKRHGQSGAWVSELLPHFSTVVDKVSIIRSLRTEEFNHAPAQLVMHTGANRQGNASIGSWVNYGLGSLNRNLPGYVVFVSGQLPGGGNALWGNGFLPSVHQGVEFRSRGEPVLFLTDPEGVDAARRRRILDGIGSLNRQRYEHLRDPEILTRTSQYELAFRMQTAVPELMDLAQEPESVRRLYGEGEFAQHCLYARRLVERGVRYVELYNQGWDTHGNQDSRLREKGNEVDQAMTGLLLDLEQRGLLDETLVIWGAEFGRTPMLQGTEAPGKCGRDHHREAFTIWMAGGGLKGGTHLGATDDLGYWIAENPVDVRDIHATLLHLMGIDHHHLTFRYQGLDQRLTGVEGDAQILTPLLA